MSEIDNDLDSEFALELATIRSFLGKPIRSDINSAERPFLAYGPIKGGEFAWIVITPKQESPSRWVWTREVPGASWIHDEGSFPKLLKLVADPKFLEREIKLFLARVR